MESFNTPESCNKFNEDDHAEERAYRLKTRKRLIIISISSFVFIGAVLCAVIGTILPAKTSEIPQETSPTYESESNLDAVCNATSNFDSCVYSVSAYMSMMKISDPNPDPEEIFLLSMKVALNETTSVVERIASCKGGGKLGGDPVARGAVDKCHNLFEYSSDRINKSISSVDGSRNEKTGVEVDKVKKWLGESAEAQKACRDVLVDSKQTMICDGIGSAVDKSREYTVNSMEIASNIISSIFRTWRKPGSRKLLWLNF